MMNQCCWRVTYLTRRMHIFKSPPEIPFDNILDSRVFYIITFCKKSINIRYFDIDDGDSSSQFYITKIKQYVNFENTIYGTTSKIRLEHVFNDDGFFEEFGAHGFRVIHLIPIWLRYWPSYICSNCDIKFNWKKAVRNVFNHIPDIQNPNPDDIYQMFALTKLLQKCKICKIYLYD